MTNKDNKEDLDKLLATASSALSKREELTKLFAEKDELIKKVDEVDEPEKAVTLIDKGLLLSRKLSSFGKNEESLLVLSKLMELSKRLKMENETKTLFEEIEKSVRKLIKESLVWENFNKAYIYVIINEILSNYGIEDTGEKIDEELIKIESNLTKVKGKLLDAKNDALSLVISPNRELINGFKETYRDIFASLKAENELETIVNLLNGLSY